MRPSIALAAGAAGVALLASGPARAETISLPPDSPRWELDGDAHPAELLGRRCLLTTGGGAGVRDLDLRDGVVDVDVATTAGASAASRGFLGIQFRIDEKAGSGEWIYLRPHKSGLPDAIQYTPVLNTGLNWQLYSGPGFTAAVDIPRNAWFHLRLVLAGARARLYLDDMEKPVLVVDDLKSGLERGQVALAVLTGETCFAGFEVRTTPDAPWERHPPPTPPGTLTRWSLSDSLDALERDLERPLTAADVKAMKWQDVEAEPPGLVAINRYRASPHPRVTFQADFSTRLRPQPGARVVYARTRIDSDRDQVRKLALGYSDEVSVFLNGRILFRGRSAQSFRDPGFLGIVDPEDDAVYLPVRKGANELVLAVSELGGGWGFVCRLDEARR